jgi:hypothetical protein
MKTSCILLCIFLLLFSCKKGEKKSPENEAAGSAADTTHIPRKPRYYTLDSTTTIAVKPVRGAPSREFRELISIVKKLNYTLHDRVRRRDSIDFQCWTWIDTVNQGKLLERLVFQGITTHCAGFDEITRKKFRKHIFISESVFPSEQEAAAAEIQIRNFIFKDPDTYAYDKRPCEFFRFKNRIYEVRVGAFMTIPDMKTVSRNFRKRLGPSVGEIMLWEKYEYAEDD